MPAKKKTKANYAPVPLQIDVNLKWLPHPIQLKYEVHEWRHASTILKYDYGDWWGDVLGVLTAFTLKKSAIIAKGFGNESPIVKEINGAFYTKHWKFQQFDTKFLVDDAEVRSPTHEVDCYKPRVGIETEWNNKDAFYDRDLNNFRLLFDLRVIDVGIIITRRDELQSIFKSLGKGSSYGASTTHMSKLLPKVEGGGAGGCPILVFGIGHAAYDPNA